MGFRFRKSIKLGGLRVNVSKKGVGYSVGVPGARYTKKADGGTRITTGLPGTGISYQKDIGKTSAKEDGVLSPKYNLIDNKNTSNEPRPRVNVSLAILLCLFYLFPGIIYIASVKKKQKEWDDKYTY